MPQVVVRTYQPICPLGGACLRDHETVKKLGKKIYNDDVAEALVEVKRRVKNHLLFSPKHIADIGHSEPEADRYLDADEETYCKVCDEKWDQKEYENWQAEEASAKEAPPAARGGGRRGGGDISTQLAQQIAQQTRNMLQFSKAAHVVLNSISTAYRVSTEAARSFQAQLEAMEDGCEDMISAFGLQSTGSSFGHDKVKVARRSHHLL